MASLNKCMFIGNLGKDPEVRTMQNGSKVANLSLACSESWKDKTTGEKKERTEWVRVVIFGHLADVVEKYAFKGSKLYVCGQMQTRKWTDKDGIEKYSTEIVIQGFGGELVLLDKPSGKTDEIIHTNAPGGARALSKDEAADVRRHTRQSRADMDDPIPF